jgi:PPOX class probable F420-dependent enzyme
MALTTCRRDGTAVSTPVWFVTDGERLLVWTDATSGKIKRIRSDPRVTVAASDVRGRPRSPALTGSARVMDGEIGRYVHRLLRRKYPVAKPLVAAWGRLSRSLRRQPAPRHAYIEVRLNSPGT